MLNHVMLLLSLFIPFAIAIPIVPLAVLANQQIQANRHFTSYDLQRAGIEQIYADKYVYWLNYYADEYGITTPLRKAHFLAQLAYESGAFKWPRELSSGSQYEWRRDLGNVHAGDGMRFKGRGLIAYTGRWNYRALSRQLGVDLIANPSILEQPKYAVLSAYIFWRNKNLNRLADADDILTITKRINGGLNGLRERRI